MEGISLIRMQKKAVDLSYLNEILGGDKDHQIELIELFIQYVPQIIALLEKAILEENIQELKKLTHQMKVSLKMFSLNEELLYLENMERKSNDSQMNREIIEDYSPLATKLLESTGTLQEIIVSWVLKSKM